MSKTTTKNEPNPNPEIMKKTKFKKPKKNKREKWNLHGYFYGKKNPVSEKIALFGTFFSGLWSDPPEKGGMVARVIFNKFSKWGI